MWFVEPLTATRPAPGREHELPAITSVLLAGLAHTGVRLLLVGGAATLLVPGTDAVHRPTRSTVASA